MTNEVVGKIAMKVGVVANTKKLPTWMVRDLKKAFDEAGFRHVRWSTVEKGSDAKAAAEKAIDRGVDVVMACGGDGTVRAAAEALVHTGVPLAVMPAGTANLFASAMNIPHAPAEAVALLHSGSLRTIDTATCNGMTFQIMAGAGFDAAMIDAADDDKERLGPVAYLRAGVQQAKGRTPFQVRVDVDGETMFEGAATCVLVGNIGTLRAGLRAFPDASPTDGLLDIGVITATGLREWGRLMITAVRQRQQWSGHAHLAQGRDVEVTFDSKHRFELDGGVKGRSKKLRLAVDPASLVVCAPPESANP